MFDSLIKPTIKIPQDSIRVHGITDRDVKKAPKWSDIHDQVKSILEGRLIIAYNSSFDKRLLMQTIDKYNLEQIKATWQCAMITYAGFRGELCAKSTKNRCHKLGVAVEQMGLNVTGTLHRSQANCMLTLKLVKAMAEYEIGKAAAGNESVKFLCVEITPQQKTLSELTPNIETIIINLSEEPTLWRPGWLLFIGILFCFYKFPIGLFIGVVLFIISIILINKSKVSASQQAKLFNKALKASKKKRWKTAQKHLENILTLNSEHTKAKLLLASLYYYIGVAEQIYSLRF